MRLGTWEIIVVLVIVLLIFGPGRIAKVAGEMGKGIKAFKDGLSEDKAEEDSSEKEQDSDSKKLP
jgi:sec-independent protein translocase protein TatA